jgi:hypothetical protein
VSVKSPNVFAAARDNLHSVLVRVAWPPPMSWMVGVGGAFIGGLVSLTRLCAKNNCPYFMMGPALLTRIASSLLPGRLG